MTNKGYLLEVLVMVLAFGIMVAGCDKGSANSNVVDGDRMELKLNNDGNMDVSLNGEILDEMSVAQTETYSVNGNSITITFGGDKNIKVKMED